jgi:3-oxoacyl-[acyl-carrier protein] reductase
MTVHDGRVALVTGGSRGIGAAVAERLAADGAAVALTFASSPERAVGVTERIRAAGGTAIAVRADSADADQVVASVQHTVAELGRLDILVNNAGGGRLDPLDVATRDEIQWILDVNVRATVLATKAALEHLGEGGRIINIGSVNADRMPIPGGSAYSMSKGAVAGFTRGLARELGPRRITVNNVQPGPVDTELNSSGGPMAADMLRNLALERFGAVEEVAALVSFLAGPEAAFITGTSVTIDGGFGA